MTYLLFPPCCREKAPGVLDSDFFGLQTLPHIMRLSRTWDSTMSMIPKGGDTIWGGLDWSPEEGYDCSDNKKSENVPHASEEFRVGVDDIHISNANYGRIISFGKDVAEAPSSNIKRIDFRVKFLSPVNLVALQISLIKYLVYSNVFLFDETSSWWIVL